jgi:hypothetical protein
MPKMKGRKTRWKQELRMKKKKIGNEKNRDAKVL